MGYIMDLKDKPCVPVADEAKPMGVEQEDYLMKEIHDWLLVRDGDHCITKKFKFDDFRTAMGFVQDVAEIAELEDHHPDMCIRYNEVDVTLQTHKIGGLHENDFIFAAKIDAMGY